MIVSYNWIRTYFKQKLPPPEKVAEALTFSVFEIDGIEKKEGDFLIDVKVLPDRAHYALCHRGVAREFAAALGQKIIIPKQGVVNSGKARPLSINIENPADCRRYIGRMVENVKINPSQKWLQERLAVLGQRSIGNVVDAANFVMFDMGQPLHAFDTDKISGAINVRRARTGERITTLDNKDVALDPETFIIADSEGPLAIAGIKGGKKAEVDENTKNLILEAANFEPALIRRTAERLQIKTDASKRFENEITPELAGKAIDEFSALIKELGGEGIVFGEIVDEYPDRAEITNINVSVSDINEILGLVIKEKGIIEILERLNIEVESGDSGRLSLRIPPERLDLKIPEDIAEEVGRLYGYDKVPAVIPPKTNAGVNTPKDFLVENRIRQTLFVLGFSEILTSTFAPKGKIGILKPLAEDKAFLRMNLFDNMTASLKQNSVNMPLLGLDDLRIFEIGKVFPGAGKEEKHLNRGYWSVKKKGSAILAEAKKLIERDLHVSLAEESKSGVLEINLDTLTDKISDSVKLDIKIPEMPAVKYIPVSPYPFIVRDVALFVPENETDGEVWKVISGAIGDSMNLVAKNFLFDTYHPKEGGKISYAFRIIFQSSEKTLTDEEVNKIMEGIYAQAGKNGWQVR